MEDLNALPLNELFRRLTAAGSLHRLLVSARDEDLGRIGDITTRSIIDRDRTAQAELSSREAGIVAGGAAISAIADEFGVKLTAECIIADGDACEAGETIARLSGGLADLLMIERTLLNLVGRLSGIASLTRRFVDAVSGTGARICETRKTTPGMRSLEKYAARCGGGTLHRLGLFDAALYKDNHLSHLASNELAGALREAIQQVRSSHEVRFVEVEVDTLEQLAEVLSLGQLVDIVLLDNMPPSVLREAVMLRDRHAPKVELEASGGITLETVRSIAETGVERISVGALTHSAPALDLGLDIKPGTG